MPKERKQLSPFAQGIIISVSALALFIILAIVATYLLKAQSSSPEFRAEYYKAIEAEIFHQGYSISPASSPDYLVDSCRIEKTTIVQVVPNSDKVNGKTVTMECVKRHRERMKIIIVPNAELPQVVIS